MADVLRPRLTSGSRRAIRSGNLTRSADAPRSVARRAYDLDRQGQQFYREKKYNEAVRKMREAVALKPVDPLLLNNLGFVYFKMEQYDDALTYLQKTLAMDPKREVAHRSIADLYLKLGKLAEARQHYEQSLALAPNSPHAEEVRRILQGLS